MKVVKGTLLLLVGLGAISLVGHDVSELAQRAMRWLHVDPEGKLFDMVVDKVSFLNDKRLKELSVGTFVYAAVLYTEGVGLWFEQRWAEWLTAIVTGSFIPYELYEIAKHATLAKFVVLAINVIVVGYLVILLKRERPRKHGNAAAAISENKKAA